MIIVKANDQAARRFLEFFTAIIRGKNSRMVYHEAVFRFFTWYDEHELGTIADVEQLYIAAYIEGMKWTGVI